MAERRRAGIPGIDQVKEQAKWARRRILMGMERARMRYLVLDLGKVKRVLSFGLTAIKAWWKLRHSCLDRSAHRRTTLHISCSCPLVMGFTLICLASAAFIIVVAVGAAAEWWGAEGGFVFVSAVIDGAPNASWARRGVGNGGRVVWS